MDKLLKKKLFVVIDVLCVFVGKLSSLSVIFHPVVVVTAVFWPARAFMNSFNNGDCV